MGADYSFYVKSIATDSPTFLGYNNSVLAIVKYELHLLFEKAAIFGSGQVKVKVL